MNPWAPILNGADHAIALAIPDSGCAVVFEPDGRVFRLTESEGPAPWGGFHLGMFLQSTANPPVRMPAGVHPYRGLQAYLKQEADLANLLLLYQFALTPRYSMERRHQAVAALRAELPTSPLFSLFLERIYGVDVPEDADFSLLQADGEPLADIRLPARD